MADVAIASAVLGGCIGVAGTIAGTALALAHTDRRETRAAALETAEAIAALEQHIWSQSADDGSALLGELRRLDVRLTHSAVHAKLRYAFVATTYSCWREAADSATTEGEAQIPQEMLKLRSDIDTVLVAEVLHAGHWWDRRRNRGALTARLEQVAIPAPPTSLIGAQLV